MEEAALAWQLEDRSTKDQILTKYLNTVYFGEGAYGTQAAARTYFDVDAKDLTLSAVGHARGVDPRAESTSIRSFGSPRRWARRDVVLTVMRRMGTIDRASFREAKREPLQLRADLDESRYPFPYFVDYFKRWFLGNPTFGKTYADRYQMLFTGGLRITTTLDPAIQRAAESRSVRSSRTRAIPTQP